MSKTVEQIVTEFRKRQTGRSQLFEQCRSISQAYNNEIALPLPDVSKRESPAVANLLAQGIDAYGMRIASTLPDVQAFPVKIGVKKSEDLADKRRRASLGWFEINEMDLKLRQRGRWLSAFSQSPVRIVPDRKLRQPKWVIRTPLETYPSELGPTEMTPDDCVFAVSRTIGWVRDQYPEVGQLRITVPGPTKFAANRTLSDEDTVQLLEWVDADETVLVIVGEGKVDGLIQQAEYGINDARIVNLGPVGQSDGRPGTWAVELLRIPNRTGLTNVVVPGRITLSKLKGQFDDQVGLYEMQAKLMAMEVNAVANAIWPDTWLVANPNQNPNIVTPADGRRGVVGIVTGGTFHEQQMQPGVQTYPTIDRIERAQRVTAGIPADFSGESATNVRTGRRGDNILSATVDFTIQEAQQLLARSVQHELDRAVAIDLAYFRNTKKSYYVNWKGGRGRLDYTPREIWDDDRTLKVSYAKAGADINALDVEIGQMVGVGLMSKLTGARMHPSIADPDWEHNQIVYESLEQAAIAGIQQQVQSGTLALTDVIEIMAQVRSGAKTIEEAVAAQQQKAQERQSSTVEPAQPGAPEAQPGLNAPGAGGEAGTAPIGPPTPSAQNLVDLLRGLRTGASVAKAGPTGA